MVISNSFENYLTNFINSFDNYAVIVFIIIQIICGILVLPCSVLTSIAVIIWGFKFGFFISLIATFLASLATYVLGLKIKQQHFAILKLKFVQIATQFINKHNKYCLPAILYANPIFPGSSLGYAFAISDISTKSFAICTLIGIFPLQLIFSLLGFYLK